MKPAGSFARMETRAPVSKTSRARDNMEGDVDACGVKAFNLRSVSLALERSDELSW